MKHRVKAVIAYDGTNYSGWQVQQNSKTLQEVIEKGLTKMHEGRKVTIFASGRTDAGVHANGQTIHFDTDYYVPPERWPITSAGLFPPDIQIVSAEYVEPSFHARYDALGKEYRYRVLATRTRDVFRRHYTYFYPKPVQVEKMREALPFIEGTHNFASFCSTGTSVTSTVRTIYEARIETHGDELHFVFKGNGFLYNMVRILVGTFLLVGTGSMKPEDMQAVLEAEDRKKAGRTAPGHGLYLERVVYEEGPF